MEALDLLNQAKALLEECAGAEREYYDGLSEKVQESEKGLKSDSAATALEEATDQLDSIISQCEEAKDA
jgi:hypothetical protein